MGKYNVCPKETWFWVRVVNELNCTALVAVLHCMLLLPWWLHAHHCAGYLVALDSALTHLGIWTDSLLIAISKITAKITQINEKWILIKQDKSSGANFAFNFSHHTRLHWDVNKSLVVSQKRIGKTSRISPGWTLERPETDGDEHLLLNLDRVCTIKLNVHHLTGLDISLTLPSEKEGCLA